MKKTILSIIFILILTSLNAQNEIKVDEKYKKICKGVCLIQQEFSNDSVSQQFKLLRKKTVKFYLFKEEGKPFPSIDIYDYNGNHITDFRAYYFEDKNCMYIKYKSPYNKLFTVKLGFNENQKSKATVVLCYKNQMLVMGKINQPE